MLNRIKHGVKLVAGVVPNGVPSLKSPHFDGGRPVDITREAAEAASKEQPELPKGVFRLPPLHLEVSRASAGAIEAIESVGGTVTCTHFNRLALRALVSEGFSTDGILHLVV